MADREKILFVPLKSFLLLLAVVFAVSATLLTILLSAASTATGDSPATAITLTEGENTGILGPNNQRWFRIIPGQHGQAPDSTRLLTLIFPSDSQDPNHLVSIQIFDEDQVLLFDPEGNGQMPSTGAGRLISDQSADVSKLVWSGPIEAGKTYYVQVLNSTDFPLEYWLVNQAVSDVSPTVESAAVAPAPVPRLAVGASPSSAPTLSSGLNQGRLESQTTRWYRFVQNDLALADHFQDRNFSLFFTPSDGNRQHQVNFELFTAAEIESWQRGDHSRPINFGAGRLVSRDSYPQTGERVWGGTLLRGDTYFLAVENTSEVEIDYRLFDQDIYDPQLGPDPGPATVPTFAAGEAPSTALPLNFDRDMGELDPAQEVWYSFTTNDNDGEFFEERALTMVVTPDDGNRIHRVNFDVFTAEGVRNWSPGGSSNIHNVGAGSLVVRDNNPVTGERFWTGWLIEDTIFYVRIRNDSEARINYWLFTADVYGPELGQ